MQTNLNDYNSPELIQYSAYQPRLKNDQESSQKIKIYNNTTQRKVHFEDSQNYDDDGIPQDQNQNRQLQTGYDEMILLQYFEANPQLYEQFIQGNLDIQQLLEFQNSNEELMQHENDYVERSLLESETKDERVAGLVKTKSYKNWKQENVVDSLILQENSAMFNNLVASKFHEDFKNTHNQQTNTQKQCSPSIRLSPKNLYAKYYEGGSIYTESNLKQSSGPLINNISTIQKPPQHPNHNSRASVNVADFELHSKNNHFENQRRRKLSQFKNLSQISNVFPSPGGASYNQPQNK